MVGGGEGERVRSWSQTLLGMYGTNLRRDQSRGLAPCTPGSRVPNVAVDRDGYWRTPEIDVGGAWQGWDTKCSAELRAWHWLAVKLRFAGGTRRTGATGCSGSTTRQAYMEPWLIHILRAQQTNLHRQIHQCRRSAFWSSLLLVVSVLLAAVELWCDAGGGCQTFRFIRPPSHEPLATSRPPFDHHQQPDHQAANSPAVNQRQKPQKQDTDSTRCPDRRRLTAEGRLKLDGLPAGHAEADRSGPRGELSLAPSNLTPYIAGHTLTALHRPQMLSTLSTA